MSTLTHDNVRALAAILSRRLSTRYSDDLVAVLGIGYESSNEAAILSWLLACFEPTEYASTGEFALAAADRLALHLDDIRAEATRRVDGDVPAPNLDLPSHALSDLELRCIARAIYLLIVTPESEDYMGELICFVLDTPGNSVEKIVRWIRTQSLGYTFYPTELTIPLAQRLMHKLHREAECL